MKTASWQASLLVTASRAGENSQTNGLKYTIKSSIVTDLIHRNLGITTVARRIQEEEGHCKKHPQTREEVQFNQGLVSPGGAAKHHCYPDFGQPTASRITN
jgi:hypothetical protein